MRQLLTVLIYFASLAVVADTSQSVGQQPGGASTPPSLQGNGVGQSTPGGQLPRTAGQEHRVYDLRPYTGYLTKHDHPEQAVIDWVLRKQERMFGSRRRLDS